MYLTGSFCAESSVGIAMNQVKMTKRSMQELEVSRIQCAGESVCLYRLPCGEVNGPRCLFRAAPRKAKRALFTPAVPASSMQRIQHATSRETGRRDLRRPSGHPASLRLFAQSGPRGSLTTHPDAALPNPQRREFLSAFSSGAAA